MAYVSALTSPSDIPSVNECSGEIKKPWTSRPKVYGQFSGPLTSLTRIGRINNSLLTLVISKTKTIDNLLQDILSGAKVRFFFKIPLNKLLKIVRTYKIHHK